MEDFSQFVVCDERICFEIDFDLHFKRIVVYMIYTVIILLYLKKFVRLLAELYDFGYSFLQEILDLC